METPPIVLVPGLLCSSSLWTPVLAPLWQCGPVTIADTRRDDSLPAMAARLLAAAPERFVLAGLSMGGYVAFEVMRQAPERVAALGLVSTQAHPDTPDQSAARRVQQQRLGDGEFDQIVEEFWGLAPAPIHADDADLLGDWRAMAHEVGPEATITQLEAIIARPDSRPDLAAIACPTSVIHGRDDRLIPLERAQETAAGIPGVDLVVIDDAGHMIPAEQRDALAAAMVDLVGRA